MTRSRGILPPRKYWSPEEDSLLVVAYAEVSTSTISDWLMRSPKSVYMRAKFLKLTKSAAYLASVESGRLTKLTVKGVAFRFQKGQVPHNKGLRRPGWHKGRMQETQFKKGRPPEQSANYKPIGSLRITRDGQLERKVTDDLNLSPTRRWTPVSRLVWEAAHGPIPPKHVVRFKTGMHTIKVEEITLDRLELLSLAENMKRNTIHNLPKPLKQVIQLRGALRRQTNKREKDHVQQY